MHYWARLRCAAAVMVMVAAFSPTARALDMPSPFVQEVLIKSILVTLNDAVASDNFTVFHAKISKPFRDQFPPGREDAWAGNAPGIDRVTQFGIAVDA